MLVAQVSLATQGLQQIRTPLQLDGRHCLKRIELVTTTSSTCITSLTADLLTRSCAIDILVCVPLYFTSRDRILAALNTSTTRYESSSQVERMNSVTDPNSLILADCRSKRERTRTHICAFTYMCIAARSTADSQRLATNA